MNNIATASPPRNINPENSTEAPAIVVGETALNSRDVLRVTLGEYEGRRTIDVRKFYRRGDGSLRPTPKGLTIEISRLPFLAETITAALDRARTDGLLPGRDRK
jgi:Transcriptional Coactivator p15 (PC4)